MRPVSISALTWQESDEPRAAVQYRVVDTNGKGHIYGDQEWVASGVALAGHPGGRVQSRVVTITYSEWGDVLPPVSTGEEKNSG